MIKKSIMALILIIATAMPSQAEAQCGVASWYGPGFHGRKTASGVQFDQNAMTAAHRTLPFGTKLKVTSQLTGKEIVVTINDRGPWHENRIIDLSKAAAMAVGIKNAGTSRVCLERL